MTGSPPRKLGEPPDMIKDPDLKNWTERVISFEESIKGLQRRIWFLPLVFVVLFLSALVVTGLVALTDPDNFLLIMLTTLIMTIVILLPGIVYSLYLIRKITDPKEYKEVMVLWKPVGRSMAYNALKDFSDQRAIPYRYLEEMIWGGVRTDHPVVRYVFDDGIEIKGYYNIRGNRTIGNASIRYQGRSWEIAQRVQIGLNEFLLMRGIIDDTPRWR